MKVVEPATIEEADSDSDGSAKLVGFNVEDLSRQQDTSYRQCCF